MKSDINPIIRLDYPDPDVIRVDETFYMVSTTMYFMPGCEILRSYDLVHWEHAAYVYDTLDSTDRETLQGKENAYGNGMWAASLRYHKGYFFVCFVANDTHKTYVYTSKEITGPWQKTTLNGFYHDNSILFDDDGRVYIVYGNKNIYIKELKLKNCENSDNSGAIDVSEFNNSNKASESALALPYLSDEAGGLDKLVVSDSDDVYLGYEGTHFYKLFGKYYLFFIHIPKSTGKRTESCFVAERPEGPYFGKDICDDDRGYRRSGVAQGGIVDTPDNKWYSILFQDSGAVGRVPVLMPACFEEMNTSAFSWGLASDSKLAETTTKAFSCQFPVIGDNGIIPESFETPDLKPGHKYLPLVGSDDFSDGDYKLNSFWQYNHESNLSLVSFGKDASGKGFFKITTDKLASNLVQAKNTLTQRCSFPGCKASVILDGSSLNDGDFAGLCILQSCYAFVGITKRNDEFYLVVCNREINTDSIWGERKDDEAPKETFCQKLESPVVRLIAAVRFDESVNEAKDNESACVPNSSECKLSYPEVDDSVCFGYSLPESADSVCFDSSLTNSDDSSSGKNFLSCANGDKLIQISGEHHLRFLLDHFTGARFGLFAYSTEKAGGSATFMDFKYYNS